MKYIISKNKKIIISLGTNLFLVLLAIFVFGTRYATDDDIAMARIAYGTFFEPQSRLVFSCTAFGAMLKGLSELKDGINWQLILYYLMLLYGGTVSFYYILKKEKKLISVVWILVVTSFYYVTYVSINFSIVASMLSFFGYITLFVGAYEKKIIATLLSALTLSFSMIIRFESFFAVSLFALFAFILVFVEAGKSEGIKRAMRTMIVPFAVSLSLPLCLFVVDRLSYSGETWAKYVEYNDNRSQILDFQSVLQHEDQEYFSELGLSEEMVNSLANWQFNDTDIFNEQLIIRMGTDSKKYNPELSTDLIFEAIGYSVEKTCKMYYFALGVLLLAVFTMEKDEKQRGKIFVLVWPWIMIIPLFAELGAYYYLDRGIDRVFRTTGLGFWCGIVVLLCCGYFDNAADAFDKRRGKLFFAAVVLVIGIICQIKDIKDISGFGLVNRADVDAELSYLNDGRVYACDIRALRNLEDSYGVWQTPSKASFYNCVELGGWMVNYPSLITKQKELGMQNPYKALAFDDNVYLLTTEDGEVQLQFLRSAYDKNIKNELVEKHGDISVYKYSVK